jgi:type IV pilus assembly protein PilC
VVGRGRVFRDRVVLRIPMVGSILQFATVERFCRMLSSMVQAGVPLPVALDLAANGAGNRAFGEKIAVARRQMIEGAGLSEPLAATGMFPAAAIQMMRVGEETGTLEQRLDDISVFYGKELEYRLKRLTDLLEPTAVVIVGIIVGFVAIAIISAIYGVFNGTKLS